MTVMSEHHDILDFVWSPGRWRTMSGPIALTTALIGGLFGLLFAVAGSWAFNGSETMSFRLVALGAALIGLWLLGSIIVGLVVFLRHNREPG